jgi:spore germination cell wall hydrolase CwlJ-like protein
MRKNLIRSTVGMIILSLSISIPHNTCLADEYDDAIASMQMQETQTQITISNLEKATQETKNSINMLKQQKEAVQDSVDDLRGQSASLQSKIDSYEGRLDDLSGEIAQAESEMSEVSAQIVTLNAEMEAIRAEIDERQQLLKSRIKSVYEKGGSKGMLQLLTESNSFRDILTRYVYMDAMVNYDRKKIAECRSLQEELEAKISEVRAREDEINAYQDDLDTKYEELEDLSDQAQGLLDSTNKDLSAEAGKLKDFDTQLAALDQTMKSLESQTAAAQAQLAKQIAQRLAMKKENTGGAYSANASELEWLAATIQAEAGGESYTGKLAVGSVIMNRVKSSAFPNTIVGVITQNMQFASYRSGKVELIMQQGASSACVKAAQEVIGGARVGDYLFFMTKYYADYYGIAEYTMIGNHAFFYRWITKEKEQPEATESETESDQNAAPENNEESYYDEESYDNEDDGEDQDSDDDDDNTYD